MKVSTCLIAMMAVYAAFGVTTNAQEWNQPFVERQYRTQIKMVDRSTFQSTVMRDMINIQRKSGMKFGSHKLDQLTKLYLYAASSHITSTTYDHDAQQWKVIDYATVKLDCPGVVTPFHETPSLAIGTYFAIKDLKPTKREEDVVTKFVRSKTASVLDFNRERKCINANKKLHLFDEE